MWCCGLVRVVFGEVLERFRVVFEEVLGVIVGGVARLVWVGVFGVIVVGGMVFSRFSGVTILEPVRFLSTLYLIWTSISSDHPTYP